MFDENSEAAPPGPGLMLCSRQGGDLFVLRDIKLYQIWAEIPDLHHSGMGQDKKQSLKKERSEEPKKSKE